jgi:3-methyl-2-oxobutanoate hydroxymethyltransferase
MHSSSKPVRAPDLAAMKARGERITMLTAYDWTMARLLDRAGIDVLLVGDSLGMVVLGHETTIPVTLEMMLHHTRAVARGTERALVAVDMPFLTYTIEESETVRNAGRLIQDGGAAAVKIEGGRAVVDVTRRLTDAGIPVMGHLGLTPQSVHRIGGYRRQAKTSDEAERLVEDAIALESAGAFAVVLESIPAAIAGRVTQSVTIPTIGIGAGPHCDGQVLVSYDMLGLYDGPVPSFVKQYALLGDAVVDAARAYAAEVRADRYSAMEERVGSVAAGRPLPRGAAIEPSEREPC